MARYALAIDLDLCIGCNACTLACKAEHGTQPGVLWCYVVEKEYGRLPDVTRLFLPVLCNHCDNPPCVRVCPTQATWKREDGIVMMDFHRCIGCRFCMAACPYGSRSFNWGDPRPYITETNPDFPTRSKGVVEKCNFCVERLARGLIPACVEACKDKALVFGDLEDSSSEVRNILRSHYTIRRKPELGTRPQAHYIV